MDWWVVLAVVVTAVVAWAYHTAQRLNRLHIRTDAALQGLAAALDHRAGLITALADAAPDTAGVPDRPGGPGTAAAARAALAVPLRPDTLAERAERERALSQAVAEAAASGPASRSHAALTDADTRVEMAMRFYNDAVRTTRALRLRPLVRLLRLGGTARLPKFFEEPQWAGPPDGTMEPRAGRGPR